MRVRRESTAPFVSRKASFPSGSVLILCLFLVLSACEPRETRVDDEPPRSAPIEDLSVFVEQMREIEVDRVVDQHIAEGIRLTALALEDVSRRTMLAHDRQFVPGMPAPPYTTATPGTRVTPTVPEGAPQPPDPADVPQEATPEVDTGVEADPGVRPAPGTGTPEQETPEQPRQVEPATPDRPIQQRWDQFVEQWQDRRVEDLTPDERAELRASARGNIPVGYHYLLSDVLQHANEIEAGAEHPRPTDRVVTAYNNLYLVMRFLVERYYPGDSGLASGVAQVEAATNAINAERPATEQQAATHVFFERAYDVIAALDRTALPPHEAPLDEVEVEDVAEPQT